MKRTTVSLASPGTNTGHAAGDSYDSIENLTGADYAAAGDTLTGDTAANIGMVLRSLKNCKRGLGKGTPTYAGPKLRYPGRHSTK